MTDKQYPVAGVTKRKGEYKVRWASDIMRIKILHRDGHEDIRLADLGQPMSKYDAIKAIQHLPEFQDAAAQSVIAEYLADKAPKVAKAPKAAAQEPAVGADTTAETQTV